jgi:uncharacterized membrane protein
MHNLISALRILHIAAGVSAFFLAPIAMLTVKGARAHRLAGKFYFWNMTVVAATAVVISLYRPIYFLTMVAIFSFYNAFAGYRVLFRKRPGQGQGPQAIDWIAAGLNASASIGLIVAGALRLGPVFGKLWLPSIAFGLVGLSGGASDIYRFLRPSQDRNFWWYEHMAGMLGSYIAALTAFSVTAVARMIGNHVWLWLWPIAIGVPASLIWTGYYRRKFNRAKPNNGSMAAAHSTAAVVA